MLIGCLDGFINEAIEAAGFTYLFFEPPFFEPPLDPPFFAPPFDEPDLLDPFLVAIVS